MIVLGDKMNVTLHEVQNQKAIVVISHGMGEHQGLYQPVINSFNEQGVGVIIYDLYGHGLNNSKDTIRSYDQFVDELSAVVKIAKTKHSNIYLLGFSMGALITNLYLISHNDVKGAIIMSGKSKTMGALLIPGMFFKNKVLKLNYSDPNKRHETDESLNHDELVLKEVRYQLLYQTLYKGLKRLNKQIKQIKTPVLILHGGSDRIVSHLESVHLFDQLETKKDIIIYPNSKHDLLFDIDKLLIIADIVHWITAY